MCSCPVTRLQDNMVASSAFESVGKLKYLETIVNKLKYHEKIKNMLHSGNAATMQFRIFRSFRPPNVNIKTYKTIISPGVLYGYETWSLTLREVH
jgi:hypothetical protein